MKQEYQDRIDDYLLHRMSDKDKRAFEDELSHNEELRKQLIFTKSVIKATKSRNEKLAAMMKWRDDHHWKERRVAAVPMNSLLYLVSGLAAVLVVGFFLIHNIGILYSPSENVQFSRINDVRLRAGSDYKDIEIMLAQQKYDEALKVIDLRLNALKSDLSQSKQDTLITQERLDYDLQVFKENTDDLTWLKVCALIGLNQKEEALTLLNNLRCEEGYYQNAADSLYIQLSK